MSQINFSARGRIDQLPRVTNIDNHVGLIYQHWFVDPQYPWRVVLYLNDGYPIGNGATLKWQDQVRSFITPPPGAWEATNPPVQPPDEQPLELAYRLPRITSKARQLVSEFGHYRPIDGIDGFGWFDLWGRQGKSIEHLMQEAEELRLKDVRIFFAAKSSSGGFADLNPIDPGYPWAAIPPFFRMLNDRGFVPLPTHGDLQLWGMTFAQKKDYFARYHDTIKPFVSVPQYFNEGFKNGMEDGLCVPVPGLFLCSSSGPGGGPCALPYMDWCDFHTSRGEFGYLNDMVLDPLHKGGDAVGDPSIPGVGERPIVMCEGIGFAEKQTGSRLTDPRVAYEMGVIGKGYNGAVFHHDEMRTGRNLGPIQRTCAEAFTAGLHGEPFPG